MGQTQPLPIQEEVHEEIKQHIEKEKALKEEEIQMQIQKEDSDKQLQQDIQKLEDQVQTQLKEQLKNLHLNSTQKEQSKL